VNLFHETTGASSNSVKTGIFFALEALEMRLDMRSVEVDYWIKSKPSLHATPFGQSVISIWDTSQEFSDSFIVAKKSRRFF
jgi:hypothetical protein